MIYSTVKVCTCHKNLCVYSQQVATVTEATDCIADTLQTFVQISARQRIMQR